jgi:radical SAM superfamily enzyme YgiQ (UPF0313 family)
MKVCLVAPATATDFELKADATASAVLNVARIPHLGILTVAAALRCRGIVPEVINLNDSYYEYLGSGASGVEEFAAYASKAVLSSRADVFGFSSICSTYPLTIRIAREVKKSRPDCTILLGGPQASVVDTQTLTAFSFVDFILRGEADCTLPMFLEELEGKRCFAKVPGLTYRSPFGPARNENAPVIQDLDLLPLPAFDLTRELVDATGAPLELGRGCPFACTFCSTNDYFRRKFRLRSPQRVLADMRAIESTYGITKFELTHDMFTVDRKRVVAFCEHLIESGAHFTWGCSARTDCVDEELLMLMAQAGCAGIFFGLESGSERMQSLIDKGLDLEYARKMIDITERLGIETTVSFITGFPEETWNDVRDTMNAYMHSLRHRRSDPQLNLLSPLAGTPVYSQNRHKLTLEELCSDMGHQGRTQNAADRQLIRMCPEIFPNFYLVPVPFLDREQLLELREFVLSAPGRLRWLLVALHASGCHILDVFAAWRQHRDQLHRGLRGWAMREYYMLDSARMEFVRFVRQHWRESISPAVDCLLDYHERLAAAKSCQPQAPAGRLVSRLLPADVPVRSPGVLVFQLNWDVEAVLDALKEGKIPAEVDRRPRFFRTRALRDDLLQLVETTPILAAGLEACNGESTVTQVLDQLSALFEGPSETRRLAAECLLETLQKEKLATVYRPASLPLAALADATEQTYSSSA